jgi:membrane-bound lytic murein transglycosylase B
MRRDLACLLPSTVLSACLLTACAVPHGDAGSLADPGVAVIAATSTAAPQATSSSSPSTPGVAPTATTTEVRPADGPTAQPVEASSAPASGAPKVEPIGAPTVTPSRPVPANNQRYVDRDDVRLFAADLAERGIAPLGWTLANLEQARYSAAASKLMMPAPAGSAKDWAAYRARFVEPKRIAAGAEFWRANRAWLQAAQTRWGVPPEIIVGVIGVETYYGRITGSFRVIDVLATLAFDFPTGRRDRTPFFRTQLAEYLAWCHREGRDPQSVLGSYAGAIGLPQFMPGSINAYAVDFDEDGHVDLAKSQADVVGSVGHYFAAHGWQTGMPPYHEVVAPSGVSDRATLLGPDIKPTFTVEQMHQFGATLTQPNGRAHVVPLALVELQNGSAAPPSYVAGTENFYVVTRYNWSSYYAMAVIQLGDAVKAVVESQRSLVDAANVGLETTRPTILQGRSGRTAP